uniref:Kininogen-1 n=1 Tax=Panagrellus redivivus TaxID=6233 RepID=A0A7E4W3J8_PANRE
MASWIAWHSARQTVSTLCFLVLIAALLVDCNAQSLERGVRAPKNKFIRFGRSPGALVDDGEAEVPTFRLEAPEESQLYLYRPFAPNNRDSVIPFEAIRELPQPAAKKRGGQKFIRFGRK